MDDFTLAKEQNLEGFGQQTTLICCALRHRTAIEWQSENKRK